MATFSKSNFKALNYNSFRPHYPPSFYNILANYLGKTPVENTIDLGCGTGVATYPLLNISQNVVGLDLSPGMIKTANSLIQDNLKKLGIDDVSRIKFVTGSVEDFVKTSDAKEHFDLITAAQCIHWFQDYDLFFQKSGELLKSGGVLAYFFYIDPVIIDFTGPSKPSATKEEIIEKAYQVYHKYVYDDKNYIGPHWENPGRNILKHFCEEVNKKVPEDVYTDITINTFKPNLAKPYADETVDLDLKKLNLNLQGYIDYISTYSGFHNYKEATGNSNLLTNEFLTELLDVTGWDLNETKVDLVWNTGYTFIRKK
ncbi:CRG1 Probable S-adenosylmethionine-dependent methyltransferase CRG1 [Candida maltosa Xu316]